MRIVSIVFVAALASACTSDSEINASDSGTAREAVAQAPAVEAPEQSPMANQAAQGLYALQAETLAGEPADLSQYAGQVTLVVNVASKCGYTRQYAGLQELHAELADQGFAVLGFPSNEFGGQEPGTPEQIREFCSSKFSVEFPMFAKSEVKPGDGQSPIYAFLEEQTGSVPGWNFCKYLVGKDGQVIAFFKSGTEPDAADLREAIEKALG